MNINEFYSRTRYDYIKFGFQEIQKIVTTNHYLKLPKQSLSNKIDTKITYSNPCNT